jgi:hypothetical protein
VPVAPLRLIKSCFELAPLSEVEKVPAGTRGMYVLYQKHGIRTGVDRGKWRFDVVYVGIAAIGVHSGVRGRLRAHRRQKEGEWTHFSVFAVHENIRTDEIKELEGLFRHIYRFDTRANHLNVAKGYMTLVQVRKASKGIGWMDAETDLPMATRRRRASGRAPAVARRSTLQGGAGR